MTGLTPSFAAILADLAEAAGLSRPAGLCLGAIWRAAQAPCADDLVAGLGLSRSNVSTALKELRGWALVGIARAPGERREFFTAPADPWELIRLIMAGRRARLLTPILDRLMRAEAESETGDVRLAALYDALSTLDHAIDLLTRSDARDLSRAIAGLGQGREQAKPTRKKKKKHKGRQEGDGEA